MKWHPRIAVTVALLAASAAAPAGGTSPAPLAWGHNQFGQVGDGTRTSRATPVGVVGLSDVAALAAGSTHSLAVRGDGTIWAWGYNGGGQLGNGSVANAFSPVQVPGLAGVVAAAAGGVHSLALRSDGTVWSFGNNFFGQLGDGTTTQRNIPVQVAGLSGVVAISAGRSGFGQYGGVHSVALSSDGSVWSWGSNGAGQLGDGTRVDRPTPVQAGTGFSAVAAGEFHTLALRPDGTVWAWGSKLLGRAGGRPALRTRGAGAGAGSHRRGRRRGRRPAQPRASFRRDGVGVGAQCRRPARRPDATIAGDPRAGRGPRRGRGDRCGNRAQPGGPLRRHRLVLGRRGSGQLGDCVSLSRPLAAPVLVPTEAQAIAAGGYHSLAVGVMPAGDLPDCLPM